MHTVFSDGNVWPIIRVHEAWRDGLDVIAITDHINYTPHQGDVTTDVSRPYKQLRDFAEQTGMILIPGAEWNEGNIHFNMLFLRDPMALKELPVRGALERAREFGAFIFWNHPGWKGKPEWFPLVKEVYDAKLLDGMELVNGRSFYEDAYPWVEEKKLTIFANSDIHGLSAWDYPNRTRPVTLIFAREASEEGVREALKSRRTAAWMNGEVWGTEEHLKALWTAAVSVEPAEFTGGGLRVHNRFAIPFRWKVAEAPEWLRITARPLEPEKVAAIPVSIRKDAPRGAERVEVKLELTNIHVGPGKNLVVTLPLKVKVD
jgi:hypothetical protein